KKKLTAGVESYPRCTLITFGLAGIPRARTVTRLNSLEQGYLDFATGRHDRKVKELGANPKVTLFFVDPRTRDHASLHGIGEVLSDPSLREAYWREEFWQYWPRGREDPNYVILRVQVISAEYLIASTEEVGTVKFQSEHKSCCN
ncbi:MAG: pyridoxamine 5'-phosphate oxidase family protein, partial [Bacillota bacterium]